jgi:putative flippase GtrA
VSIEAEGKEKEQNMKREKKRELLRYAGIGLATTAVNWLVYVLLLSVFSSSLVICNLMAWLCAVTFSFFANKYFVFRQKENKGKLLCWEAIRFVTSRLFTGALEVFLPSVLVFFGLDSSVFGVEGFGAKALTTCLILILNYVFAKGFVFRHRG